MNPLRTALVTAGVFSVMASAAYADENAVAARPGIVRLGATGTTYSVESPVVVRVQGTAFFRTLVAFTNNTQSAVTASYQFSYTCVAASCSPAGGFYRTAVQTIALRAFDSFVQDDFVDYLDHAGSAGTSLLQPGASQGTIGTLLVTFTNLPSSNGWEANVVARTYNRIVEADPSQGTVGFAYNASLFFESAHSTLVGFARDTQTAPTIAGNLSTNLGVRSTDIDGSNQNVTVDITFYDTATGQRVGNTQTFQDLRPGELRQITDVWAAAGIDHNSVKSIIIFVDARNPTSTSPTIEGFVSIKENQLTKDTAFFEMKCADTSTCGQ